MSTFWKPFEQNELYHYGVIGMKWGVRRDKPSSKGYHIKLDEKKANSISEFPVRKSLLTGKNVRDKRQYRKQIEFESFLDKHLTFSDDYKKAVAERDSFARQAKRDKYGEIRSKHARDKVSKLNDNIDKEVYKLLGLEEDKLTPIARIYLSEVVNDVYSRRIHDHAL